MIRKKSVLIAFAVVLFSVGAIGWWCIDRKTIEIRPETTRKATTDSQQQQQQPVNTYSSSTTANNNNQQWFPSLEWIENCVVEETPKALEKGEFIRRHRFLRSNKNKKQRRKEKRKQEKNADSRRRKNTKHPEVIGDCVKHCTHCGSSTNNSFTDMFRRVAGCGGGNKDLALRQELGLSDDDNFVWNTGNYEFVEAIHRKQASSNPKKFFAPPPSTLAIHLRLGDIIEKANIQNVTDLLVSGGQPGIRGGSHSTTYENGIKSVYEILENVYESYHNHATKAVHIRGGSHISFYYQKSRVYANCLHRAVKEGFRRITKTGAVDNNHNSNSSEMEDDDIVSMIIEGSPSEVDFYYLSHAKQLVVAPGAFSHLMGKLVERRGGSCIGRTFDGLTWKTPQPPP